MNIQQYIASGIIESYVLGVASPEEVTQRSTHIRVHKYWRIAFIVIFALSKILLFGFIYYLIQFRHTERDLRALQDSQIKTNKANLSPDPADNEK